MKRTALMMFVLVPALAIFAAAGWAADLPPREGNEIEASDYSIKNNWAMIPNNPDKPADVFLLYPTTYWGANPLAGIDDAGMRQGAADWYTEKGSAFATAGNVYMPYYRQVNALWGLTQSIEDQKAYLRGAPKTDALAAFDYYLKHYNNGRPFMIASHSQGSTVGMEILFDYFVKNPEPAGRMVAAYLIGYSITAKDLERNPKMKFAKGADDTGVIISYNTIAPDAELSPTGVVLPGAMAINPISWTRSDKVAPASANLGSYMDRGNGHEKVMGLADAKVDVELGAIICSTADKARYEVSGDMKKAFGEGSFHKEDLSFYYYNLRENAENRVEKYLNGKTSGCAMAGTLAAPVLLVVLAVAAAHKRIFPKP